MRYILRVYPHRSCHNGFRDTERSHYWVPMLHELKMVLRRMPLLENQYGKYRSYLALPMLELRLQGLDSDNVLMFLHIRRDDMPDS